MRIRHFLLLVVVLLSSWVVGCAPARSEMDYLASGGRGEVSGCMSGVAFSAVVQIFEGGERVCVEYLSPASLCGLILEAEGEVCEVRLGDVSFACVPHEISGFLRPVTAFLPQGEVNSVQKIGENTILNFPTGETLTLSPEGEPLSLVREDIEMQVIWWERGDLENLES